MMFLAIGITTYLRGGDFWHTHIINISYILSYIVFSGVAIWRIKVDRSTMLDRVRNPYDSKVMITFLVSISIILNVIYYLFPNRWYALCVLMEKLVGESINEVNRNLLYLVINDRIVIPNIGIFILIGLLLILFYKIIRKGVKSIL